MRIFALALVGLLAAQTAQAEENKAWYTPDGAICIMHGKFTQRHVIEATRDSVISYGVSSGNSNAPEWGFTLDTTAHKYIKDKSLLLDCMQASVSVAFPQ